LWLVHRFIRLDTLALEGNVEPQIIAPRKEPVADRLVHPLADAADDLTNALGRHAERLGHLALLEAAGDDEAIHVEAATRRNS